MALTAIAFEFVETFVTKLAEKLFYDYSAGRVTDFFKLRKLESAQRRVVDHLLATFEPFLQREVEEDHVKLLVNELTATVDAADLSPGLVAECAYSPEKVLASCLQSRQPTRDVDALRLTTLYEGMLRQVAVRFVELAPMLPDWERANWEQAFTRLERIEEGQRRQTELINELQQAPSRQTETFERHYRRYVAAECGKIQMRGIRVQAEALSLPLDVAFVDLKLSSLPRGEAIGDDLLAGVEYTRSEVEHLPVGRGRQSGGVTSCMLHRD